MVANDSIDFAFSFDLLVHAEADILKSYQRSVKKACFRASSDTTHIGAGEGRVTS